MKKILFLIFMMISFQGVKALEIENIAISANSNQEINVTVFTNHTYVYQYISHQYSTIDNTITLEICYNTGLSPTLSNLENSFQIPLNTAIIANYSIIVKVYFFNFQTLICDYQIVRDMDNLQFSTPINGTVYLETFNHENKKNKSILFPNPSNGMLFYDEKINIDKITVYNTNGQLIYHANINENQLDLFKLTQGIYLIKIQAESGNYIEKIVLKK